MSEGQLERAIKRAHNRGVLFEEVRKLYPTAEGFAEDCSRNGQELLCVLAGFSKVVQWAICDAVAYGLETDLMEERKASENRS
jgi:hypothetical protein